VEYEDAILEFENVREYAEYLVDVGAYGQISDEIMPFIDYEAIARSLDNGGEVWASNGYLFRNL
jgi:hypothetical protein